MRKTLLYIFASLISFIAFAQHVEYYPSSQRYHMEPYIKPEMNLYDSSSITYPLSWMKIVCGLSTMNTTFIMMVIELLTNIMPPI